MTNSRAIEIVRENFLARQRANRSYSLRAFARDLKISPAFLSLFFSGKKKFSLSRAKKASELMKLPKKMEKEFLRDVEIQAASNRNTQDLIAELRQAREPKAFSAHHRLPLKVFREMKDWYYLAILQLVNHPKFKLDKKWVAEALHLSTFEAEQAISILTRFGLIRQNKLSQWEATYSNLDMTYKRSVASNREFHRQMMRLAALELQKKDQSDFEKRNITGITVAISNTKIEAAKEMVEEFKARFEKLIESKNRNDIDEIFQLNVQFFPLTHIGSKK
jgi:uncharacterized protein (TIGR02147 family)